MRVTIFASGSTGNCLLLSDGDTRLLIDAGISLRRMEAGLAQADCGMQDMAGVLITHEHSDHICGLTSLLKRYELPIFAPHTVAARLGAMLPAAQDRLRVIPVGEPFPLGGLRLRAFHTPHDTEESVGYRAEGHGVFAIATDTGCLTEELLEGLRGADTALIEANHDERLLCDGPYPFRLKRRILSDRGHLSNARCAELALSLAESGTRRLILGHLSRENNTPALAMETVGRALEGSGTALYCAPPLGCLTVPVGEEEPLCCL